MGDAEPRYPLLQAAVDAGRFDGSNRPDPARRGARCGPWVDGRCQKCGRLDPLDLEDELRREVKRYESDLRDLADS